MKAVKFVDASPKTLLAKGLDKLSPAEKKLAVTYAKAVAVKVIALPSAGGVK